MRKVVLLGLPALLIEACAGGDRQPQPRPSATPQRTPNRPPAPASRPVPSNATYVATAASIDLFEIRASEFALQRSPSRTAREFAGMMIRAHQGTSSQLSFAGRRLNLLPSASLQAKHQAMLDQLRVSSEFDALYKQQQLAVHREALALHRDYWARGTSPTLRPVAVAAFPLIERHLRMASYL